MIRSASSALLVALALMLGALAPATAAPADEMGAGQAGRYYLKAACEAGRASERFSWKIWLGRDEIPLREVQQRFPEIKRITRDFALAMLKRGDRLENPPKAWPAEIQQRTQWLSKALTRYGNSIMKAAQAGRAAGTNSWSFWIKASRRVDFGKHAKYIREYLALPRDGGCGRV